MSPAALVLALLLDATPDQDAGAGYTAALAELEHGRFHAAELALAGEEDPLLAARGRLELSYRGRDFPRALELAREALALAPADLGLLHRAASAALWLRRWEAADELVTRLDEAVRALGDDPARLEWSAAVLDFRERARRGIAAEAARARAVGRARTATLVALALAVAGGALLLRRS